MRIGVLRLATMPVLFLASSCLIHLEAAGNIQPRVDLKFQSKGMEKAPAATSIWRPKVSVALGGGYFMPLRESGDVLDDAYLYKLTVQSNIFANGRAGAGIELCYTNPQDQKYNGGITYAMAIPYLTVMFLPLDFLELQLRGGGGTTYLRTSLETNDGTITENAVDFTFTAGVAVITKIYWELFAGIDLSYYHFFEKNASAGAQTSFFMGYRF